MAINDIPDVVAQDGPAPNGGIGLCLSGGGFRAMLFHIGTLRRLNETGRLVNLTRVASVSGGSIVAALLGKVWKDLEFEAGVAGRFEELVELPLLAFADTTVDVPAVLTGLWPGRISRQVAKAYDRHLFHGATLQDLPADDQGPRFVILATNLSNGTLWRFTRSYMRDWRTPPIDNPVLRLADAVAASSAFPPVLSPMLLEVPGRTVHLTDGGVYDNLGLEPVVKRCAQVFVSDGGGTFGEPKDLARDWIRSTLRVLETIDVEVRRLRRRQVVGLLDAGNRSGAFWAINSDRADFTASQDTLKCPIEATRHLAAIPTRLAHLHPTVCHQLINWGYAVTDAALRSHVDDTLAEPSAFPYPEEGVG
jgi:NTE family protein